MVASTSSQSETGDGFLIAGPLSLGEILDRSFRLYRASFGAMTLTVGAFAIPMGIAQVILAAVGTTRGQVLYTRPAGGGLMGILERLLSLDIQSSSGNPWLALVAGMLDILVLLALTYQSSALLHGTSPPFLENVRCGLSRYLAWVGALGIQGIVATLLVLLVTFLGNVCFGVLIFLMVPAVIILFGRWAVAVPALVVERMGPIAALQRSWELTEGYTPRSILFVVLVGLLEFAVLMLPVYTLTLILEVALPAQFGPIMGPLSTGLTTVVAILWQPISAAARVIFFYDQKIRKESYDLDIRLRELVRQSQEHVD